MITKGSIKMEIRHFIRNHHQSDIVFGVIRDDEGQIEGVDVSLGSIWGTSIPLDVVYDTEGDEIDKEVFVEELKAIVDEHNNKYSSG